MRAGERSVLVAATDEFPRHSEASILVEAPGVLLLAWSRFAAVEGAAPGTEKDTAAAREWAHSRDNNPATIAMMRSTDAGATWSTPWTAIESSAGINVMQPSLLADGPELVMTYSERNSAADSARVITRSRDGGLTWSPARRLLEQSGYLTAAHDRLVVLDDGRWLQPAHELRGDWISTVVLGSDDRGESWSRLATLRTESGAPGHLSGVWEASIAQRGNGSLLMAMRSAAGSVFFSESADRGGTWTPPEPSPLRAPSAPSLLRSMGGDRFALIRNDSYEPDHVMLGARTPLVIQVSDDGGRSWGDAAVLESEHPFDFHYACCAVDGDALVLAYSVTDPSTRLWSLALRTITYPPPMRRK